MYHAKVLLTHLIIFMHKRNKSQNKFAALGDGGGGWSGRLFIQALTELQLPITLRQIVCESMRISKIISKNIKDPDDSFQDLQA